MKIFLITLLCSFLFVSCQSNKDKTETLLLKHEVVTVDDSLMMGLPMKLGCVDGNLIILDFKADAFFHWIKLPDFRYMGTFGRRGQGPDEYLNIKSLYAVHDTLYAYDFRKSELIRLVPHEHDLDFESVVRLPKSWATDLFSFDENLFCTNGCFEKGMFHLVDSLGNVIYVSDDYPARDGAESNLSNQTRFMAYQGCMVTNGEGRFAYLTSQSKQCHIYELQHDSLKKIAANIDSYPQYVPDSEDGFSVTHNMDAPVGYRDAIMGDNCFYALYSGRTFKEFRTKSIECTHLYSYDWDGKLLATYELDVPVTTICLNKEDNCFYGVAYIPDPTLVRFPLAWDNL